MATTRSSVTPVLIAGAGPTGLLLALWLAKAGIRLRIVDPRIGPTEESRAIVVQARTLELYDQLEIGQEAFSRGRHFDAASLWVEGRQRGRVRIEPGERDHTPHPYAFVLTQDENEKLLIAQLAREGVQVEWGTRLEAYSQDLDGVVCELVGAGGGELVRACFLAGCDGAHSTVRHGLDLGFVGGTYNHTFFVADIIAGGRLQPDDINLSLASDRFMAFFPMPGTRRHRVLGPVPPHLPQQSVDFEAVRPLVTEGGLADVERVNWFSTYRVSHRVAERFRVGRVFLLGDAAHIHSPVGGQGMNTGLGDAANLAWKLAQTLRGGDPAVLDTYEAERRPFAERLVTTTDRVFQGMASTSRWAGVARSVLYPALFERLSAVPRFGRNLFSLISQLRIAYPESALSQGRAGKVAGGQRLPWLGPHGPDNYAPLRQRCWQIHCSGKAQPELQGWCRCFNIPLYQAGTDHPESVLLVRPDGYVGLAMRRLSLETLERYRRQWLPSATSFTPHQELMEARRRTDG